MSLRHKRRGEDIGCMSSYLAKTHQQDTPAGKYQRNGQTEHNHRAFDIFGHPRADLRPEDSTAGDGERHCNIIRQRAIRDMHENTCNG